MFGHFDGISVNKLEVGQSKPADHIACEHLTHIIDTYYQVVKEIKYK